MEFEILSPRGPALMTPKIIGDSRGYFMETFRQNEFAKACGDYTFVQDNQSKSSKRVLRGLHYQLRHPQGKIARVISGKVFDVAVDLRKNSPDFGSAYSVILDSETHRMFWVPPGFAHGFLVLSDEAEFIYKCTDYYAPGDEKCLLWHDPALHIDWPLTDGLLLSEKDKQGLRLRDCEIFENL